MSKEITKTSKIEVNVGLNENHVPLRMKWSATDGQVENQDTKAMMLAMWDADKGHTLKIDLWTEDMSVEEMRKKPKKYCDKIVYRILYPKLKNNDYLLPELLI